ncbi:MAG: hypothetical protein ACJ8AT_35565 [Hyalangium sp.]|uniref:hypothetical protein n=1 Tax=Hyalangium sp. TaxID=2028555 RepID=UPI00389AE1F3
MSAQPTKLTTLYVSGRTSGPTLAEVLLEVRGLAVTRSLDDGLAVTRSLDDDAGWVVTHVNSGASINAWPLREDAARSLCHALAALRDWTHLTYNDVAQLQYDKRASAKIRAAVAKARAEDAA